MLKFQHCQGFIRKFQVILEIPSLPTMDEGKSNYPKILLTLNSKLKIKIRQTVRKSILTPFEKIRQTIRLSLRQNMDQFVLLS